MNDLTKIAAVMAVVVAVFGCMVIASDDSDAASTIYVDANASEDTTTNTHTTLASAVTAAQDGDTITLKSDLTTAPVTIDKGVTLNLGGHKIEISAGTGASGIKFSAGSSTVSNGTITDTRGLNNTTTCNYEAVSVIGKDTSVSFSSLTINQYVPDFLDNYNYAIDVEQGAAITLNSGTRIVELAQPDNTDFEMGVDTWGVVGIAAWGARHTDTYSTDVTINSGVSIKVSSFAISGSGTHNEDSSKADYCNTNITINGGDIVSTDSQAIYHPQAGNLTVNGGNITGTTGIELRSGNLTITGGTIKATGTDFNSAPNGNGSTTSGVAVVISQHTTALPIDVKISGGTMSGLYALYEVTNETTNNPEVIDIEVTGGDFSTTDTTGEYKAVWTEDVKNFVSGGTFDGGMDEDLLAEGVEMDDSGKVVGQEGVTFDVTAAEFLATGSYSDDGKTVTFFLDRDYRITDINIDFADLAKQGYESISIAGNGHTIYGGLRFDADYDDGESQSYSVTISDLNLDGKNISDWGYGIVIQNQSPVSNPARTVDFTMTGGSVKNFDSKGIYLINVQSVYIQGVEIENCAYNTHYHDEANEDFRYYVRGDYAVDIDVDEIGPREHKPDGTPEARIKIETQGA